MKSAIVTGAGGLVGSEAVEQLIERGYFVVGIDNDMRAVFFGEEASTKAKLRRLCVDHGVRFAASKTDIRDAEAVERIVSRHAPELELVVHTAAQPSHDWAATDPHTDFGVNAVGTLNLLEAVRRHCPHATFAHISTSKVYGDTPNRLPLLEGISRLYLPVDHEYANGIRTSMSIDNCLHSLFGVSKVSGDLLVQEYGRYFEMPTVCFRPGCVTGPAHAGVELHGFLAYLMKCATTGRPYTVYGYDGKQVRCNITSRDLVAACLAFHENPKVGAVYNIGGGRESACSMLEAIRLCQEITGEAMDYRLSYRARIGDHRWWISDITEFQLDYPGWSPTAPVEEALREIYEVNAETWRSQNV